MSAIIHITGSVSAVAVSTARPLHGARFDAVATVRQVWKLYCVADVRLFWFMQVGGDAVIVRN